MESKRRNNKNKQVNNNNNNNNNNSQNIISDESEKFAEVKKKEQELRSKIDSYNAAIAIHNSRDAEHQYKPAPALKRPSEYNVKNSGRQALRQISDEDFGKVIVDPAQKASITRSLKSQSSDLAKLRKQFESFREKQISAPLQGAGGGLSGETAAAVRMFVDPDDNPAVPVPGRNPESLLRGRSVVKTSMVLQNGKATVIATPFGRFQTYVSRGWNDTAGYDEYEGYEIATSDWTHWHGRQYFSTNVSQDTLTTRGKLTSVSAGKGRLWFGNDTYPNGIWKIGADYNGGAFGVGTSLKMLFNDLAVGQTLEIYHTERNKINNNVVSGPTRSTVVILEQNFQIAGDSSALMAGQAAQTFLLPPPTVDHDLTYEITVRIINGIAGATYTWDVTEGKTLYDNIQRLTWRGINNNNTYDAFSLPTLVSIMQGGLADHGAFLAMSCLITNDSSSLNNNGFIQACSLPTGVLGANGQDISDYISQRTQWNYMGRLEKGAYQVYVPTAQELMSNEDIDLNPFCVGKEQNTYNMVYLIDNSVTPNGENPPKKLQCHIVTAAVFSSAKIDNFIPQMSFVKDHSYEVALGYLRHYYRPCCNPSHKDSIANWLEGTFKSTISHAKRMISQYGPSLIDGTAKVLKEAIPLVATACAVAL